FSELPLEIVVDVRSFTITHLAEPEEIVIPDFPTVEEQQPIVATATTSRRPAAKSYRDPNKVSKVNVSGKKSPVLVVPEPNASTKLKTPSLQNTKVMNRAPMSSRKQIKPRQSSLFKRFTLLVVGYIRERFVWARRKPDTTDADHDKRIAENYIFDEVLGVNVPRSEFEKRAKFNNDQKSSEADFCGNVSDNDKTVRFPSRPRKGENSTDSNIEVTPLMLFEHSSKQSQKSKQPNSRFK
ncbi:conjugal transfer protein, partial [Escherichia coli]